MPNPTPGADPIVDLICQFFAGPYSAPDHAYVASTIAGVGTWRRGWDKLDDFSLYTRGMAPGTATGAQFVVKEQQGIDRRLTMPAVQGRKHGSHLIDLYGYFWSTAAYSEDVQDALYQVRNAIVVAMRNDPTCGTGGMEAGFFQAGIPDEHGQGGEIAWNTTAVVTTTREGHKAGLIMHFEAHEIPVG